MNNRIKTLTIVVCLMGFSYFSGSFVANYRWLSTYWMDSLASGEQNSVKYSIIYMEKYMKGDRLGAHDWIRRHSTSDPEWILNDGKKEEFIPDALSMVFAPSNDNLMSRMQALRIRDLKEIEEKQSLIREYINGKNSENEL